MVDLLSDVCHNIVGTIEADFARYVVHVIRMCKPCSQLKEEGQSTDALQPASSWERSRQGRLFAFQWPSECV